MQGKSCHATEEFSGDDGEGAITDDLPGPAPGRNGVEHRRDMDGNHDGEDPPPAASRREHQRRNKDSIAGPYDTELRVREPEPEPETHGQEVADAEQRALRAHECRALKRSTGLPAD